MAVRKICKQKGCRASPRCSHPWWFDVMHQGRRWRMPVDDFALARGATAPITSKQNAEHVWEPTGGVTIAEVERFARARDARRETTVP